jgi:hypothetical protein
VTSRGECVVDRLPILAAAGVVDSVPASSYGLVKTTFSSIAERGLRVTAAASIPTCKLSDTICWKVNLKSSSIFT